jgi:hypothetical protein
MNSYFSSRALTVEYINRSMNQIQDWVATVPYHELERE